MFLSQEKNKVIIKLHNGLFATIMAGGQVKSDISSIQFL